MSTRILKRSKLYLEPEQKSESRVPFRDLYVGEWFKLLGMVTKDAVRLKVSSSSYLMFMETVTEHTMSYAEIPSCVRISVSLLLEDS